MGVHPMLGPVASGELALSGTGVGGMPGAKRQTSCVIEDSAALPVRPAQVMVGGAVAHPAANTGICAGAVG